MNSDVGIASKATVVPKVKTKSRLRLRFKRDIWMYVLIAPGLLYFLVFKYLPMWGIVIAFQDYQPFLGILHSKWVGLANFTSFFESPDFLRLFANTLILSFLNLVLVFPIPIVVALMLNEIRIALVKRGVQTLVYIPHFISMVVVTSMTYVFFTTSGGYVNQIVQNVTGHTIPFLTSTHWFRPLIIIQTVWQTTGWSTIIILAALTGVNPELYEAAIVDGAGRWRMLWHITLPAIRSTIVILLILRMGHFLDNGFEQIYLMSNSLNRSVADVFDTYVYYIGLTNGEFSFATAVGLFKSVISIVLVLGANKLAKKFGQEGIY